MTGKGEDKEKERMEERVRTTELGSIEANESFGYKREQVEGSDERPNFDGDDGMASRQ